MIQESAQQDFIDAAAETFLAVDEHDGHAAVESLSQVGVGVDIDHLGTQPVPLQDRAGFVAQVTAAARVENNVRFWHGLKPNFVAGESNPSPQ